MNIKLLLIEDELLEAEEIVASVKELFKNETVHHFEIEHLPGQGGEVTLRDRNYLFYNDSIIQDIQGRIDNCEKGTTIGLLLDVVLTEEELDSKYKNFYPEVKVARKIYDAFQDKIPIYIVTSVPNFFTHSVKIMGVELSDQFILKDVLLKYRTQSTIKNFKDYFIEWGTEANG